MAKLIVVLLVTTLAICARAGKYDAVTSAVDAYLKGYQEYSEKLEHITDSKALAAAINGLANATEQLKNSLAAFDAENPELSRAEMPPEVKRVLDKVGARSADFQAIYAATEHAVQQFGSSPAVIKAYERLGKANAELAPNRVSTETLYAAYQSNKIVANEKYDGREIVLTGDVWQVSSDSDGPYAILSAAGSPGAANAVWCRFIRDEGPRVARLPQGGTITVTGRVDGNSYEVTLINCRLQ